LRYHNPIPASPDEIQQIAIDILLYKARNNKLIIRMDYMTKKLKAGIPRMRGKTATQKAKSIVNWDAIREEGEKILTPAFYDVLGAGGNSVMGLKLQKQERFDPIGIEAVTWTTAHSAELVVEITEDTMLAIRDTITTGINAGKSMPTIARELRPTVGLHSQYAGAVSNYHTSLLVEGVSAGKAAAKAETYAGRLHRRRTQTIARTETAFGLTEGQRQGYDQMGIGNLERVEDPECCDICAEYNGKIYSIKESEGVLPEHPNCEGTWIAATGEKPEMRNFYNNVTDNEIEILQGWSSDNYLMTRKYLRAGEIERENLAAKFGTQLKTDAETMEKLFMKYKDGVSEKILYRGIGEVPDDIYKAFKSYKKGSIAEIDTAISSWTTDAETMKKFSQGKNSIRLHLKGGRSKTLELDIKDFSSMDWEKEVILNTHKFKITAMEEELIPSPIPGSTAAPNRVLNVFLEEAKL